MVRCEKCENHGMGGEFSHPYETGLRSRRGGYPILTGFILPTFVECNSCGEKVKTSGWFNKDPYL